MTELKNKKDLFYISFLTIVVFVLFTPMLDNFFIVDDTSWIKNAMLLKNKGINVLFEPMHTGYYRPLPLLFFLFNFYLFGLNPTGYYLINLLLYSINVILVYFLGKILSKDIFQNKEREIGFLSALIFATFGPNYEVALLINVVNDLLSTFFILIAIILFVEYLENNKTSHFILSLVSFFLSVLSKETAIILPGIIIITHILYTQAKESLFRYIKFFLPYFLIGVIYFIFYQISIPTKHSDYYFGLHSLEIIYFYSSSLFPSLFGVDKSLLFITSVFETSSLINYFLIFVKFFCLFSIILISAMVVIYFLKKPTQNNNRFNSQKLEKFIIYCILWIVLALLPISFRSELLINTPFPEPRYLHLPSIGFSFLVSIIIVLIYYKLKSINPKLTLLIFLLILNVLLKNSFSLYIVEKGINNRGKLDEYYIHHIGQTSKNNPLQDTLNVYLINAPKIIKHFYQFGLADGVYIFYNKNINIIWSKKEEINNLKNIDLENSYFFEFFDQYLSDKTLYYREKSK